MRKFVNTLETWENGRMPDAGFVLKTSEFEGPLDLLLSLIQDRKLYINEVSLASVTDDYLNYVQSAQNIPIGETAQFVVVAATLLLIKSRSLLPSMELSKEEEQSIEELERRLAQYRLVKQGAKLLSKEWGRAPRVFAKRRKIEISEFAPGEVSVSLLKEHLDRIVKALPNVHTREVAHVGASISIDEMIDRLSDRISRVSRASFRTLTEKAEKEEVVVHFLALLELVKLGSIAAMQQGSFADITLESDTIGTPQY